MAPDAADDYGTPAGGGAARPAPAAPVGRFGPRRFARWVRRRPKSAAVMLFVVAFVLLNLLAFVHAYSMTHFVSGGARTPRPDQLTRMGKVGVLFTGVTLAKPLNTMTPATFNLPYTTHRYRGADGTEYEAWHVPANGPPWRRSRGVCLLFPGYAGPKASVLDEAVVARQAGFDAFLVDFRGCGGSSGNITTVGYVEAEDVAEAVNYVNQTLRPKKVVMYGRSMGAAAVLRAVALGKARADALVVESPFDRMLSTVDHRFEMMGVPPFPLSRMLVFWGGVQQGYWAFGHNPVDYAKAVNCPTLLIRAGHDPFIRKEEAESVYNHLAGPRQMLVFEGAGHQACIAVDRRKFARAFTDFLVSPPQVKPAGAWR
jgi:alpha-beta hydrolase superfamily lysophospholipase